MYTNIGYLSDPNIPLCDMTKPIVVTSCGLYRLKTREILSTWRPNGRSDFQILYVASGKCHFYFSGIEQVVSSGHMVLMQPQQEQHYEYFLHEKPVIYWIHFTGNHVKSILRQYEIPLDDPVFYTGDSIVFANLFNEIIYELQTNRIGFDELLVMYLRQILLLAQRIRREKKPSISEFMQKEIEYARAYFTENYNKPINIEEYVLSRGMSLSWFQRNFKNIVNYTPMQYLLMLRMNNARKLLETSEYSIATISSLVGYDDPLYFSRLFHKANGMSPSSYRNLLHTNTTSKTIKKG